MKAEEPPPETSSVGVLAYLACKRYTQYMTTTENLTSNSPQTKAFYDRVVTKTRVESNPNGCAYCDTDRCQHTDN